MWIWGIVGFLVFLLLNHYVLHLLSKNQLLLILGLVGAGAIYIIYFHEKEIKSSDEMTTEEAINEMVAWIGRSKWSEQADWENTNYTVHKQYEKDTVTGEKIPLVAMVIRLHAPYGKDYLRIIMDAKTADAKLIQGGVGADYLDNPYKGFSLFNKPPMMPMMGGKKGKGAINVYYGQPPQNQVKEMDSEEETEEER